MINFNRQILNSKKWPLKLFGLKIIFCSKLFWVQTFLNLQLLGQVNVRSEIFCYNKLRKNQSGPKDLSKEIFVLKNFGSKKFLFKNNQGLNDNLRPPFIPLKFGSKTNFLSTKDFCVKPKSILFLKSYNPLSQVIMKFALFRFI